MKKIIAVAALVACTAGIGHAVNSVDWQKQISGIVALGSGSDTTNPVLNIKPSANVFMGYNADAAGVAYTVGAYHGQGSRAFATSSVDTNIYYMDFTGGTAQGVTTASSQNKIPAVAAATAGTGFTGWTASK